MLLIMITRSLTEANCPPLDDTFFNIRRNDPLDPVGTLVRAVGSVICRIPNRSLR